MSKAVKWLHRVDDELAALSSLVRSLDERAPVVVQTNSALHMHGPHFIPHMGMSDPRAQTMARRVLRALQAPGAAQTRRVGLVDAYSMSVARADLAYDGVHFGSAYSLNAVEMMLSLMCPCTFSTSYE